MDWTTVMLLLSAMVTTVAAGAWVWLRRPAAVAPEVSMRREPAEPEVATEDYTSYLPYEMLGFAGPPNPPATESTEYIPIERLPVMAAFRRQEAARVAAVLASSEDATEYIRFEEVAQSPVTAGWNTVEPGTPLPKTVIPPEQIGVGSEDLGPLFDLAVEAQIAWATDMAMATSSLAAIAAGSERIRTERMAMLAGASEHARRSVFETTLDDREAPSARRVVACLALLERDPITTLKQIERLVDSGDTSASIEALRCWSSHAADALLVEQARRTDVERTHFWLERLLEHGLSVGDDRLAEWLDRGDGALLRISLGLLCFSEEAARHLTKVQRHYFAANAEVRVAAVAAGVFLRDRVAWLHCRQMATDVSTPRATELIARLGSTVEQDSLLDWAERAAITDAQLWGLALSGRCRAANLAVRRLPQMRGSPQAIAGLRHVIGGDADEAEISLLARWNQRKSALRPELRYLVGSPHDAQSQRECMSRYPLPHRLALAEELLFRSGGVCRLRIHGLAGELDRQLSILDTLELDGHAGFPWN